MDGPNQTLLSAAIFLVIAVVILSVRDITEALPQPDKRDFGPEALPFSCDLVREGAGLDDRDARLTLTFDATGDGAFAHCATLTRGGALRPRTTEGEVLCFAHRDAFAHDLWDDSEGGRLRITDTAHAHYLKRERAVGAEAFAPTGDSVYTGSCERVQ